MEFNSRFSTLLQTLIIIAIVILPFFLFTVNAQWCDDPSEDVFVGDGKADHPILGRLDDGWVITGYEDFDQHPVEQINYLYFLDNEGYQIWGNGISLNSDTTRYTTRPKGCVTGEGNLFIAWEDFRNNPGYIGY